MSNHVTISGKGSGGNDAAINVTSGAAHVVDLKPASGPIYDNGTYKFFGEAVPGSALTAAVWSVSRLTVANNRVEWADGNTNPDNVYTDLATVAAFTFS